MIASALRQLAEKIRNMGDKHAYVFAFVLGCVLTLAFPPFFAFPALIVAFTSLVWLLEGRKKGVKAWLVGWWFGFGHYVSGYYWITIALSGDGGAYLWVVPFAIIALPAWMALFTATASFVFYKVPLEKFDRLLVFAVAWAIGDHVRSWLFSGFPWNLTGYVWTAFDETLQFASVVGVYGMSIWAVVFGSVWSLCVAKRNKETTHKAIMSVIILSICLTGWGHLRLSNQKEADIHDPSRPLVRVVQASVPQDLKWDPERRIEALSKHVILSRDYNPDVGQPTYVVWPETAMPYQVSANSVWPEKLGSLVPPHGALLTGTMHREVTEDEGLRVFNSMIVVNGKGELTDRYDKNRLVPFGEFLPLRWAFNFFSVDKVTHGSLDFTVGEGARILRVGTPATEVQPLICYETIFAYYRPGTYSRRPDWLVNITNDGWFGNSTGPYQHFHMARTRAVERGVPMVRAANTGVSGVFDAYGRVMGRLGLGESAYIDVALPRTTKNPTPYSKYGDFLFLVISCLCLIFAFRPQLR